MKIAKSILFDGAVEAEDCDYLAYKQLLLVCPKCGEPVYLASGKIVSAHFKHFKNPDLVCEIKSGGKNKTKKSSTGDKNQRYRFFQKYFWTIVSGSLRELSIDRVSDESRELPNTEATMAFCLRYLKVLTRYSREMIAFHYKVLSTISLEKPAAYGGSNERVVKLKKFLSGLSLKIQQRSAESAVEFLATKRSRNLAEKLGRYALYDWSCHVVKKEPGFFHYELNPRVAGLWMAVTVISLVCGVPWQEAGFKAMKGEEIPEGITTRSAFAPGNTGATFLVAILEADCTEAEKTETLHEFLEGVLKAYLQGKTNAIERNTAN